MMFIYLVGDRRAFEFERREIDVCLVQEYLRLLALYEGVLVPIPPGAKAVIDALKNLGKSWVKGDSK